MGQRYDPETETLIPTHGGGFDVTAFAHQQGGSIDMHTSKECALTLQKSQTQAVSFQPTADCLTAAYGTKWNGNASATNGSLFAQQLSGVRRLTPRECERLQGFPDDYTLVPHRNKPMSDGPRYKALGNSMAVPVMRWIGERIQMVQKLKDDE